MDKEELIGVIVKYIAHNWHASLGYGDDEEIITSACDDIDWLMNPAGITTQEIIKSYNK